MMLPGACLPLSAHKIAPAEQQLLLTYPVHDQRALVVYQPLLPATGATSAKAASAGEESQHPCYHAMSHSASERTLSGITPLFYIATDLHSRA